MIRKLENIALVDMDGTICDYDSEMFKGLEKLRHPSEPKFYPPIRKDAPKYIHERSKLITQSQDWWANLPKFQLGWDVMKEAKKLGYRIVILTQGPRRNPAAWKGKKIWIDKYLGEDTDIIITRDKGLVYGKVLVDDFPPYMDKWLAWRPRGLGIIPASKQNENYHHPQVMRYDGTNLKDVKIALKKAMLRNE